MVLRKQKLHLYVQWSEIPNDDLGVKLSDFSVALRSLCSGITAIVANNSRILKMNIVELYMYSTFS